MTLPSTSLRIMRDPYFHKKAIEHNDSLLSPPLTPIEAQSSWYVPRKRKNFIGSYARMAPLLRPSYSAIGNDRIFALNVYRDLLLIDSTDSISTNKNKNSSKDNKQCSSNRIVIEQNDCAMSDKAVVSPTKRRRTVSEVDKKRKRNSSSSVLPTGKDAAAAFDAINIDLSDDCFYPQDWVPSVEALDFVPVKVSWKGAPLLIEQESYYDRLHKVEASMASILRLSPVQYLRCKRTLILAARTLKQQQIPFTKSVAQKLCRVDVNKTSALWTAFGQLGWLESNSNNDSFN